MEVALGFLFMSGQGMPVLAGRAWCGLACCGDVWYVRARRGMAGLGVADT